MNALIMSWRIWLIEEVDEDVNDGTAADAPNLGRVRAAVQNITHPRNGGISDGLPWTGGSRATRTSRSIPKTSLCFRHTAIGKTVFLRCEKGVDDGWMIKTKPSVPLSSSSVKIKDNIAALGLDSVFDVRIRGVLVNLFNSTDAVLLTKIRAHKEQLGQACEYNKQNFYYS